MSMMNSPEYLERRADEERSAAAAAVDERAAQAHRELAEFYDRRAKGGAAPEVREEPSVPGILPSDFRILP